MNRLRVASCCLSLALLTVSASAQQPPGSPPKTASAPTIPKAPADYSQEPFVIEQYSTVARFENDGTGEHDLTVRIHVLRFE
jgi:hypothetical protein